MVFGTSHCFASGMRKFLESPGCEPGDQSRRSPSLRWGLPDGPGDDHGNSREPSETKSASSVSFLPDRIGMTPKLSVQSVI